jgi:hypothetical protein
VATSVSAQRDDFIGRSELTLAVGGMNYIGDLNNQSAFGTPHVAFGAGLRSRLDNRWALRLEANYGNVSCKHDYIELRNLSFRSHIIEGVVMAEFNFRPFGPGATESIWTPYIFGGIGAFHFNPEAAYFDGSGNEVWVPLQPLSTEGQGTPQYKDRRPYALTQLCMPFGVGVKLRMGKSFSLTAEYGFRKTWTDYLDDVSTTYVDGDVLLAIDGDGEMAAQLADRSDEVQEGYVNASGIKRGDESLKDWYACFHISIGVSLETLLGWTRSKRCKL